MTTIETVRRVADRDRRSKITPVRLTPGERARIEAEAAARGLTLSRHIRALLLPDTTS